MSIRSTAFVFTTPGLFLIYLATAGCASAPASDPALGAVGVEPGELQDYVRTPGGLYHKSCVPQIEDGASVDDNLVVTRADGTSYQLPECRYPHYATQTATAHDGVHDPTVNGWVEDAYRYNGAGYEELYADWYVPASPDTGGGLVYLFPGFEPSDGSRILQPVLQWGWNGAFGGDMWTIASWSCASGSCPYSAPYQTWPNHHIYGAITPNSCSGGVCYFTTTTADADTGASTALGWQAHVLYTFGFVTLEAYGIDTCSEYPSSGGIWMNTSVWRTDGALANGGWNPQYYGVSPGCGQYVYPYGDAAVGLYWSP